MHCEIMVNLPKLWSNTNVTYVRNIKNNIKMGFTLAYFIQSSFAQNNKYVFLSFYQAAS